MKWFSARQENAPVVLDHGYLQRLSKHIGEHETRELLADGMLDLTDRLAALHKLGEAQNLKGVADLMHEIAGAAGHQGLTAMSHAAFEASRVIREQPNVNAADMAALVLQYQEASISALAQFCSGDSTRENNTKSSKS